ncbi:DUF2683 family protein [Flavobacterium helocola]|jgi:hypothetical protein|uniref:DUF2683 family protein n=1 Tax=Flavobacterium helocola TaxID=3139139 RepID=A0ABU9I413_9FLAO
MSEHTFIIHTETPEQESALKAFVKALKMKFEISKEKTFVLSSEQQKVLDSQIGLDKKHYKDADIVFADLKNKYGL